MKSPLWMKSHSPFSLCLHHSLKMQWFAVVGGDDCLILDHLYPNLLGWGKGLSATPVAALAHKEPPNHNRKDVQKNARCAPNTHILWPVSEPLVTRFWSQRRPSERVFGSERPIVTIGKAHSQAGSFGGRVQAVFPAPRNSASIHLLIHYKDLQLSGPQASPQWQNHLLLSRETVCSGLTGKELGVRAWLWIFTCCCVIRSVGFSIFLCSTLAADSHDSKLGPTFWGLLLPSSSPGNQDRGRIEKWTSRPGSTQTVPMINTAFGQQFPPGGGWVKELGMGYTGSWTFWFYIKNVSESVCSFNYSPYTCSSNFMGNLVHGLLYFCQIDHCSLDTFSSILDLSLSISQNGC